MTYRKARWIGLGITTLAGALAIMYYLIVIPQTLAILNTDAIVIATPSAGREFTIGDTVEVTVLFDPAIIGGEATGYYLIYSSPDKVFLQEEATGLSYTTAFTLTRDFIANLPAESLIIRTEMTISSKTYYNELVVSVIDPRAEK